MNRFLARHVLVLLLGYPFTGCARTTPAPDDDAAVVFAHVRVVPMDREVVLEDYTVIVRGDRIREVGPAADVAIPSGATVIRAEGEYLMPGLTDMHVHLEDDEDALLLFLANGVTTVRNMWGKPKHLEWRQEIVSEERIGPTIHTTGPITDADPPMWEGSTIVTTPDAAVRELLAQKEAGYDAMKIMTNLTREVYEALLTASKEHDFPVYGHVPLRVGFEEALGMGQRSFEHTFDFVYDLIPEDASLRSTLIQAWERRLDPANAHRAIFRDPHREASIDRIPEVATEAAASGAWFCPTLVASRRMHLEPSAFETLRRMPYNEYVPAKRRENWNLMAEAILAEDSEGHERALAIEMLTVEALHRAGAHLLVGTDTHPDLPYILPGFSVHEELQNLVDVGLSPYEALRAATIEAAAVLDESDNFGAVRPGLRADLIVVHANPLVNVGAVADRVGVMIRGRWLSESDLQARLESLVNTDRREKEGVGPPRGRK